MNLAAGKINVHRVSNPRPAPPPPPLLPAGLGGCLALVWTVACPLGPPGCPPAVKCAPLSHISRTVATTDLAQ